MIEEGIKEAGCGLKLNKVQADGVVKLIHKYHETFGLGENISEKIDKYTFDISLDIEKPYSPILKKALYPDRPRYRI